MYDNDKKQRITLRLNEEQFEFVRSSSERQDITPSEWLRQLVNSVMFTTKAINSKLNNSMNDILSLEEQGRANDKTNLNS